MPLWVFDPFISIWVILHLLCDSVLCFESCCYYTVIRSKLPLSPNNLGLSPSLYPPLFKSLEKNWGVGWRERWFHVWPSSHKKNSLKSSMISIILRQGWFEFLIIYYSLSECGNVTDLLLFNYFGCFWYYYPWHFADPATLFF